MGVIIRASTGWSSLAYPYSHVASPAHAEINFNAFEALAGICQYYSRVNGQVRLSIYVGPVQLV